MTECGGNEACCVRVEGDERRYHDGTWSPRIWESCEGEPDEMVTVLQVVKGQLAEREAGMCAAPLEG